MNRLFNGTYVARSNLKKHIGKHAKVFCVQARLNIYLDYHTRMTTQMEEKYG